MKDSDGTELLVNAQIHETDGNFYNAKLWTVPRVGELIRLNSRVELMAGSPPIREYQIVQIVHEIGDVTDVSDPPARGTQLVKIWVKPASSDFFGK